MDIKTVELTYEDRDLLCKLLAESKKFHYGTENSFDDLERINKLLDKIR